jgi:hypothetical protein
MRSGRRSPVWTWVAGGAGLAALAAGAWWLLAEQTRGAEIATVLALTVTIVAAALALVPAWPTIKEWISKGAAGRGVEDLDRDYRDLVELLRFELRKTKPSEFARRHNIDPRTVNKILKGEEFPSPTFISVVIHERDAPGASPQSPLASAEDLRKKSHDLYLKALEALDVQEAEVGRLKQALRDSEEESERAAERERKLSVKVRETEAEQEQLVKTVRELEGRLRDPQSGSLMLEAQESKRRAESRRASLDKELAELRVKLAKETKIRIDAENLSKKLRKELDEANKKLATYGGSPVVANLGGPGKRLFARLRESKMRWGGWIGAAGVVSVIYLAPFYCGLIYGSPGAPALLKISTIYALAVIEWFTYTVKRIDYEESGLSRVLFIVVVTLQAVFFLIGVFI